MEPTAPQPRRIVFERDNHNVPDPRVQLYNLAIEYWNWLLGKVYQLKTLCLRPISNLKLALTADPEILERIGQTRGWKTAAIRCIEFHPKIALMALVNNQDVVLIYDGRSTSPTSLQPFQQKDITCAAFRPWSPGCELAVGCAVGICLWRESGRCNGNLNIRHMLGTHRMRILKDEGHNYVTSLQWNEDGTILISAALGSSHIILWEPDCQQKIRLIPAPDSLSSFALLRYSPDFQMLFCASCDAGASLCQLNRSKWKSEQVLMQNRIQTAVWTTCSSYLLFVRAGSTRVYSCTNDGEASVFLRPKPLWNVEMLVDLQEVTSSAGELRCGGQPQTFAMDPLGIYMAIIFKESCFVLLCLLVNSRLGPLRLLPVEFIDCDCDADCEMYPTCIGFGISQPQNRCLVICWSEGHIQRYLITAKCLKEAQMIHNFK
ncbi:hypothetical protein KR084_007591 [Drosophila pseudotakahashii]|nr:hypothetical protein KR084_007591 [Drosophila pseudotakahashii]